MYLFAVLEKNDFVPNFIFWIKLLYLCPSASILTNSQQSQLFNLRRGTRQGCPLSPLLFDLAIEPLPVVLHSSKEISGVWRNGVEHKVVLYADDLLFNCQAQFVLYLTSSHFLHSLANSRDRSWIYIKVNFSLWMKQHLTQSILIFPLRL